MTYTIHKNARERMVLRKERRQSRYEAVHCEGHRKRDLQQTWKEIKAVHPRRAWRPLMRALLKCRTRNY